MPEKCGRLIEGTRLIHFRLRVQFLGLATRIFARFVSGYRLIEGPLLNRKPNRRRSS